MRRNQRIKRKQRDLYLSWFWCFGGLFFIVLSPFYLYYVLTDSLKWLFAFIPWFGAGAAMFLCWLNQSAWMISDSTFVYRTMFGRETEYQFSEIRDVEFGDRGGEWLILENKKIPIDIYAITSNRFIKAVNAALKENEKQGRKVIPYNTH